MTKVFGSLLAPSRLRMAVLVFATFVLVTCGGAEEREKKYVERGKALYEQGDYVKASLEFKNALQINPKGIDALYHLGLIDEKQGEFRLAFNKFDMVVKRKPDHFDAHVKLGNYYLLAKKMEDAVKHAETAKTLDQGNPKQMALFGKIYFRQEKLDKAEEQARLALSTEPENIEAAALLAAIHAKHGDSDKALQEINRSLDLNENNTSLRLFKIKLLIEKERI